MELVLWVIQGVGPSSLEVVCFQYVNYEILTMPKSKSTCNMHKDKYNFAKLQMLSNQYHTTKWYDVNMPC
jgi:hypothetical protein